ncbi:hypothetical protein SKAU_G00316920 [Synaphobranchus kaupii]|uniref:Ig-like domain-containing protein n=1 Tax=Synaphobranchus kaupii TaxID=118154 RepID=A0A9Q1ESR6_SYNKA|nr:hypothetical protein SKAU_G00316920 [Synaphobranchus kaupii]
MEGSAVRHFTPFWFSVEPVDTLAVRGAPALLNCSAHSDTPARVDWKKDGTFLNLASDDRRQLLPDGSLLITSVVHSKHNKPDEGVYQCEASIESLGTISSRTARLTVADGDGGSPGGWLRAVPLAIGRAPALHLCTPASVEGSHAVERWLFSH